jgi:hypothetical protein
MHRQRIIVLIVLTLGALAAFGSLTVFADWGPVAQDALTVNRVYAYRDWQSTGLQLDRGDRFTIRAQGEWLYSPFAGPNGPEGHVRYRAPDFYPLPGVGGGALIGRVGEDGRPFYVGRFAAGQADRNGLLYLRIDDDLLGDNAGSLMLDTQVIGPTPTPKK